MEKYINPDSDGRFYALQDAVAANCHDCVGCSRCCEGMGDSIVLDPYDLYQFQKSRNLTFDHLMQRDYLGLTMRDGIILPHLKMTDNGDHCPFLTGQGRCSIHNCRPGMCRLFPLGRDFQGEDMKYILLENACSNTNRTDVTVGAWIGVEPEERYHVFADRWRRCSVAQGRSRHMSCHFGCCIISLYPGMTSPRIFIRSTKRWQQDTAVHLRTCFRKYSVFA